MIDRDISYHVGKLKRGFEEGTRIEESFYIADETNFVVDIKDGRNLDIKGDIEVKLSDVVSGDVGMKIMVMIGRGSKAHLEIPFIIFQKERRSYNIQGVQDIVPGVCYQSGQKGWMCTRIFLEWISEKLVMNRLPGGSQRIFLCA